MRRLQLVGHCITRSDDLFQYIVAFNTTTAIVHVFNLNEVYLHFKVIIIPDRNVSLTYKYLLLIISKVNLDPLKSIDDVKQNAYLLAQEVQPWQEQPSGDFPRK